MHLRNAQPQDAELLRVWRNDPLTRESSRSMREFSSEEFSTWLTARLTDPLHAVYIAEVDGQAVGTIRSELHPDEGYCELSYTVAPEHRGNGYATAMAQLLVKALPPGTRVECEIKKGNQASERVADALGLSPQFEKPPMLPDPRPLVVWR